MIRHRLAMIINDSFKISTACEILWFWQNKNHNILIWNFAYIFSDLNLEIRENGFNNPRRYGVLYRCSNLYRKIGTNFHMQKKRIQHAERILNLTFMIISSLYLIIYVRFWGVQKSWTWRSQNQTVREAKQADFIHTTTADLQLTHIDQLFICVTILTLIYI